MSAGFTRGHYLLGIEGLALLRANARRSYAGVEARVAEIGAIAAGLAAAGESERRDLPSVDAATGYAGWAASYDEEENDTVAAEQPLVRALLDELPPGPVLDAACGTGRHVGYLLDRGREAIGVDASAAMLERAGEKLPGADLRQGDLAELPCPTAPSPERSAPSPSATSGSSAPRSPSWPGSCAPAAA